jgi:hypothetical protein
MLYGREKYEKEEEGRVEKRAVYFTYKGLRLVNIMA